MSHLQLRLSRRHRRGLTAALVAAAALSLSAPQAHAIAESRPVDLVICLDTSGSMTALIDSARAKLWEVVNELSRAKPTPKLRVGLLTYGSPNNSTAAMGWVHRHNDLTDDLDTIYANMMAMSTDGGDEFVGWVLHDAVKSMNWSSDPNALRIIFVAGNESADQARENHDFRGIAETARGQGMFVNAIYAGGHQQGISEKWHEVAACGGGHYSSIDMDQGTIQISTPQDNVLMSLNSRLNDTYLPYGARGAAGSANQMAQDANATKMGVQSIASRSAAKGTSMYSNSYWDLVDAIRDGSVSLEDLEKDALPEKMQDMTPEERKAYVEGMQQARSAIQKEIQETNIARQKYIAEQRKQAGGKASLDDAILKALREQAKSKGFVFESDAPQTAQAVQQQK